MKKNLICLSVIAGVFVAIAGSEPVRAQSASNLLENPGFEVNPPSSWGNNVPHSITPWKLTNPNGGKANVVRVDGPGGWIGTGAPNNAQVDDAVGATPSAPRHYFDIAGSNTLYQSFTAPCSGPVRFGGYFSGRLNRAGSATVSLRQGPAATGVIVGSAHTVSVPAGDSRNDPWQKETFTANLTAGMTYSLVVTMTNDTSFDEAFVELGKEPCCPPWDNDDLVSMMAYQGSGAISAPYTLVFQPTTQLGQQMQAYIDYLHAVDPNITSISIKFGLLKSTSNTSSGATTLVGSTHLATWAAGGNGTPTTPVNFFTMPAESMSVNHWYRVKGNVHLNDGIQFFPKKCIRRSFWIRLQFKAKAGASKLRRPDGGDRGFVTGQVRDDTPEAPVRLVRFKRRDRPKRVPLPRRR